MKKSLSSEDKADPVDQSITRPPSPLRYSPELFIEMRNETLKRLKNDGTIEGDPDVLRSLKNMEVLKEAFNKNPDGSIGRPFLLLDWNLLILEEKEEKEVNYFEIQAAHISMLLGLLFNDLWNLHEFDSDQVFNILDPIAFICCNYRQWVDLRRCQLSKSLQMHLLDLLKRCPYEKVKKTMSILCSCHFSFFFPVILEVFDGRYSNFRSICKALKHSGLLSYAPDTVGESLYLEYEWGNSEYKKKKSSLEDKKAAPEKIRVQSIQQFALRRGYPELKVLKKILPLLLIEVICAYLDFDRERYNQILLPYLLTHLSERYHYENENKKLPAEFQPLSRKNLYKSYMMVLIFRFWSEERNIDFGALVHDTLEISQKYRRMYFTPLTPKELQYFVQVAMRAFREIDDQEETLPPEKKNNSENQLIRKKNLLWRIVRDSCVEQDIRFLLTESKALQSEKGKPSEAQLQVQQEMEWLTELSSISGTQWETSGTEFDFWITTRIRDPLLGEKIKEKLRTAHPDFSVGIKALEDDGNEGYEVCVRARFCLPEGMVAENLIHISPSR